MAGPTLSQSLRSPNSCCSKKILLLLMWEILFTFSWSTLLVNQAGNDLTMISKLVSNLLAPFFGWLADVKFGRYNTLMFSTIVSFLASMFLYFALIIGEGVSTLGNMLLFVATAFVFFGESSYRAAMLPFLTDQIVGATSDELSSVVRWYYWARMFGLAFSDTLIYFYLTPPKFNVGLAVIFAVPLAVIIISDCLCQQWLDRTHKVTNPIKLIIQVLNYTRKHRYPERRSAFTYIDEEQPTRMDYGKDKFGGPFTEEEVEDVKTVLRLLPIVICLFCTIDGFSFTPIGTFPSISSTVAWLNYGLEVWLIPLLLIPFYQLIIRLFVGSCNLSMLQCISAGFSMLVVGLLLLVASEIYGVIVSDGTQRYLLCTELADNATTPDMFTKWYCKLGPCILYSVGYNMTYFLLLEFLIAQSPDKMKGFVFGTMLGFSGVLSFPMSFMLDNVEFTICFDLPQLIPLIVLFVVFLILSKRYTLRERNREINIQAIAEEHYERYMDQEEEYIRENPQYFESLDSDSYISSNTDSD